MEIEFFIVIILYLSVILALHFLLKKNINKPKLSSIKNVKNNSNVTYNTNNVSFDSDTIMDKESDDDLILNKNELDITESVGSESNIDFVKYLENDIKNNKTDSSKSKENNSLDRFFIENQEKYQFNDVPSSEIISDSKKYSFNQSENKEIEVNEILAFDEFTSNNYATF